MVEMEEQYASSCSPYYNGDIFAVTKNIYSDEATGEAL
jgi:hypothetical protein